MPTRRTIGARSNLTLNFGLRYELNRHVYDVTIDCHRSTCRYLAADSSSRVMREASRSQRRVVASRHALAGRVVCRCGWSHDRGVPGKVVAQLMGHANVDTTLNVYTQVLDGSLRDAVDKVGSELFTIVHKSKEESPGTAA
jgi:hypothetical protein